MTAHEMRQKGGKRRWRGSTKAQRSAKMREVAYGRWGKPKTVKPKRK